MHTQNVKPLTTFNDENIDIEQILEHNNYKIFYFDNIYKEIEKNFLNLANKYQTLNEKIYSKNNTKILLFLFLEYVLAIYKIKKYNQEIVIVYDNTYVDKNIELLQYKDRNSIMNLYDSVITEELIKSFPIIFLEQNNYYKWKIKNTSSGEVIEVLNKLENIKNKSKCIRTRKTLSFLEKNGINLGFDQR